MFDKLSATHALAAWKSWLAGRDFGMVPIAEPRSFQWAGWWIAIVDHSDSPLVDGPKDQVAVLAFGTPPGVVLSPQDPTLLGHATADLDISSAYAVASLNPVIPPAQVGPSLTGVVELLAIAPLVEAPMQLVEEAHALAGRGLEGDRYANGKVRDVAGDIEFPNGMVITPDGSTLVVAESFAGRLSAFDIGADGSLSGRRSWAKGLGPDGICIDSDGGIWAQTADADPGDDGAPVGAVVRVLDGGEVTHRVETDLSCFSCALGGPEGRHLFLLCNEFEGVGQLESVLARRSARIYVTEVPN